MYKINYIGIDNIFFQVTTKTSNNLKQKWTQIRVVYVS